MEPVGVGVDEKLNGEDEGKKEVESVGECANLGCGAVGKGHVLAEFGVEDAHDEVLVKKASNRSLSSSLYVVCNMCVI